MSRLGEQKAWNAFAFVSDWQRQNFEKIFWVRPEKIRVMRNAVAPAFADCSIAPPWFTTGEAPVLFYSSTPFRGLDVLLKAFPRIRAVFPDARLRVYSSMGVYQVRHEEDQFRPLYEMAQSMDGVDYIGSVSQDRLAQEVTSTAALAYPSTFPETSCITVMEAMAAGAAVFTTRLGALPETTGGYAAMVDWLADKDKLAENFTGLVIEGLQQMLQDPTTAMRRREQRLQFLRKNYLWPARANEWTAWLEKVVGEAKASSNAMQP